MFNKKMLIVLAVIVVGSLALLAAALIWRPAAPAPTVSTQQAATDSSVTLAPAETAAPQPPPVISDNDHLQGSLNAPVKIIAYTDFTCSFCAQLNGALKQVRQTYGNQVVMAWRNFPLLNHPNGYVAADAFECLASQGSLDKIIDGLFALQDNSVDFDAAVLKLADRLGVDKSKFSSCYQNQQFADRITADKQGAVAAGVIGAPHIFLNGQSLAGAYQFEDFTDASGQKYDGLKTLIDKELNKQ